jgi:hypothetical protein
MCGAAALPPVLKPSGKAEWELFDGICTPFFSESINAILRNSASRATVTGKYFRLLNQARGEFDNHFFHRF